MDRDYYRMLDDEELIEHARNEPTAELAIVLAERLEQFLGIDPEDIN